MVRVLEKIAFLVEDLGPNLISYLAINKAKNYPADVIFFFENHSPFVTRPFNACMHINELYCHQDSIAFATNISTAKKLVNIPGPRTKYYYLWDLEFISHHQGVQVKDFSEFASILSHPELLLITRTEEHAKLVESTFGVKVHGTMFEPDFKVVKRSTTNK